jgi:hypothetical protein
LVYQYSSNLHETINFENQTTTSIIIIGLSNTVRQLQPLPTCKLKRLQKQTRTNPRQKSKLITVSTNKSESSINNKFNFQKEQEEGERDKQKLYTKKIGTEEEDEVGVISSNVQGRERDHPHHRSTESKS